ncbi:hypothetical protein H6P81_004589 [Aristolochia fimbriata]|uniref:Uncharacterized protein n=1 Tax=Aristolochia fimbriata TaxID=158543 RepID=A0AAV7ES36_ARIFI|nr:hypothetical protein H6P81_004589 [Aristolochia fimbriata]
MDSGTGGRGDTGSFGGGVEQTLGLTIRTLSRQSNGSGEGMECLDKKSDTASSGRLTVDSEIAGRLHLPYGIEEILSDWGSSSCCGQDDSRQHNQGYRLSPCFYAVSTTAFHTLCMLGFLA